VKAFVFSLEQAETDPACSAVEDTYLKCLDIKILPQINADAIEPGSANKVVDAVKTLSEKIAAYNVPPERLYIVGSSSMQAAPHSLLVAGLTDALHPANPIDFVSVQQEANYGFDGVLGTLPYTSRKIRQNQAGVIDIGSGNVKASFLTQRAGDRTVMTFGIDYGTKKATDEIQQLQTQQGSDDFRATADRWRTEHLIPEIREVLDANPGMGNRNRFYLLGGIVWAMTTLTHEGRHAPRTQIEPKSIDSFLATASEPNASSTLCSDEKKMADPQIGKVCDTFSVKNLIAGTEILKGLSDEFGFVKGNKHLFFFDALYVWDLGYLQHKVYPQHLQ
jgi:hypothetical protein